MALEKVTKAAIRPRLKFQPLLTVSGIGEILGLTILLETGAISRFDTAGNYASYCRCFGSEKISNGKLKGCGNTSNSNRYLAWAFVEAANLGCVATRRSNATTTAECAQQWHHCHQIGGA